MTRTTRLLHPVDRTAPALPRLRLPTLAALLTLAASVAQAFSAREDGHLRPAHWLLLAGLLALIAYAPFVLLGISDPHFGYFSLPLACAWAVGFSVTHAISGRKTATLAEQLPDGRLLWDLSQPHQGYRSVVTTLVMERDVPVTYLHGVAEDGQLSEDYLDGSVRGRHDHWAAVELAGYGTPDFSQGAEG